MSTTLLGATAIARAAAPLIKDLYEGSKGTARAGLKRWSASTFTRKLGRQLSEIDAVRTIWSPEKNVSLRNFYYPSRLLGVDAKSIKVDSIAELGQGCIVVQGIVGQGKSILLRYLAIQEITKDDGARLPIFLELRKVTKTVPLLASIYKTLSAYEVEVDDDVFAYLAVSGRIVILLDGFDELETPLVRETTLELEHLAQRFPELQIVVTSRPNNEVQKLNSFRVLQIAPLRLPDYSPFLRTLGLTPVKTAEIVHAIQSSPSNVSALISTPLMLTLVVFVYQSEKQIPADLPEFFDRLFYTVFTRHDKLKAAFEREHHSGLSERKLQILFEAFSFMSLQLGTSRTLSPAQFTEAFELAQDYVDGSNCKEAAFRKDITKVACLMLEEGVGDTTFLHKSIAEYHAAAFVRSSDDAFAVRFYEEAATSWNQWQECLRFLQSIDSYRFSKYFALDNLKSAIPVFESLSKCNSARQLIDKLPSWITQPSISYRAPSAEEKAYKASAFGSWKKADNYYTAELPGILSKVAFDMAPSSLSESEIAQLKEENVLLTERNSLEFDISLGQLLTRWGMDELQEALQLHVANLQERYSEATALADKLERRVLIFDRKRKAEI